MSKRQVALEARSAEYLDLEQDIRDLEDDQAAAQEHGDLELVEDLERALANKRDHLAYLSEQIKRLQ